MITWDVLTTLQTALKAIKKDDDYLTDIGKSVLLEPYAVDDDVPGILITMSDLDANQDDNKSAWQRTMAVQIQASAPGTDDNAMKTVHQILEDIEVALAASCLAPKGISRLQLESASITQKSDGSEAILGTWTCSVTYKRKQ